MFVAMPEGTVISQLFSALSTASSPSDAADKVADLLQENGFGGITADEFFSILGTSAAQLLASSTDITGGPGTAGGPSTTPVPVAAATSTTPAYIFDLRVFGTSYTVTDGPPRLMGETLAVSHQQPAFRFLSQVATPTTTTDTTTLPYRTTVSWSKDEGSYNMVFTVTPDSQSVLAPSFSGTATLKGDTAKTFAETQVVAGEESQTPTTTDATTDALELFQTAPAFPGALELFQDGPPISDLATDDPTGLGTLRLEPIPTQL